MNVLKADLSDTQTRQNIVKPDVPLQATHRAFGQEKCVMLMWSMSLRVARRAFVVVRAKTTLSGDETYCMELTKKADYYNYLCAIHLPPDQRRFACFLRAFNAEISQVPDRAPTRETARIRFRYWLDAIDAASKDPSSTDVRRSPVVRELCWARQRFRFSQRWLSMLVEARANRVDGVPFATCLELERYAEMTNAPIHYMLAESFGIKSVELDHALSHLGKAQGILTHIRSVVPLAQKHSAMSIPTELLVKHNVATETLLRLCSGRGEMIPEATRPEQTLRDVCYELASLAHVHATKASRCANGLLSKEHKVGHSAIPANVVSLLFLPLVPVDRLLHALSHQAKFDPRHASLFLSDGLMPLRITWRHRRGGVTAVQP
nr:unnamed protein product [Spirometra erinaceieuropaei]